MIYVCAGMYRSGSTWLYNAVRLILEEAGVPDVAAGWIADREKLLARKNSVLKVHAFLTELASPKNVILTSHRDLRDVAASLCRKFKSVFSMETIRETVEAQGKWAQLASYDLRYENLLSDRSRELRNIARSIRLPQRVVAGLSYDRILEKIEGQKFTEARATAQRFDAVNLLHDGHVTDGRHGAWAEVVPPEMVREIETEFRPWLTARGYLT